MTEAPIIPDPQTQFDVIAHQHERHLALNDDAERAVIGSLLLMPEMMDEVHALLPAGAIEFAGERWRVLYSVIGKLRDQQKPIDGLLIRDELLASGQWDSATSMTAMAACIQSVPTGTRAARYAELVHDAYVRRCLMKETWDLCRESQNTEVSTTTLRRNVERVLREWSDNSQSEIDDSIARASVQVAEEAKTGELGLSTGLTSLDTIIGGLYPGELTVIGARPSVGKSALIHGMMLSLALQGVPVLLFTLEMRKSEIIRRFLSARMNISARAIRAGRLDAVQQATLEEEAQKLAELPIYVRMAASMSVEDMRALTRVRYRTSNVRAVFVDYLQLMSEARAENRNNEIGRITRGFKTLALELNIPVVAAAQLNRQSEKDKAPRRPRMSDLRDSGNIEQDTDCGILIHREGVGGFEGNQEKAWLIVGKQRNGETGTVEVKFEPMTTTFKSLAVENPPINPEHTPFAQPQPAQQTFIPAGPDGMPF